mgnify:CR=1 FL=1
MTTTLIATYANGVFTPETPVDLPENAKVHLVVEKPPTEVAARPEPGSPEAWQAYIQHLKHSTFRSGEPRPSRDELYEGR